MGIGVHEMQLLRASGGKLGDVLTFGRQGLAISRQVVADVTGTTADITGAYAEDLLIKVFGATSVSSLDNSDYEGATYVADLNHPVSLARTFDTVIDFGTAEHVFDVASALRNAIRLCRVGGRIIQSLPANGECGHGLYQFSPELFLSLYTARNGFGDTRVWIASLMDERHWWRVLPPRAGQRVTANAAAATYILCITTKVAEVGALTLQQSDYVRAWEENRPISSVERPWAERFRNLVKGSPVAGAINGAYRGMLSKGGLTRFNDHLRKVVIGQEIDAARLPG